MLFRLILPLLFFSTAALAECPKSLSEESGLILTRNTPFFSSLYTQTQEGVREQRILVRSGKPENVSTYYPHPLAVGKRIGSNGTLHLKYSRATDSINDLPKTKDWKADVILQSNGKQIGTGSSTLSFKGHGQESIGDCQYRVWVIDSRLNLKGQPPISFMKYYSPELNLVLRSVKMDPSGKALSQVHFDLIEIKEQI